MSSTARRQRFITGFVCVHFVLALLVNFDLFFGSGTLVVPGVLLNLPLSLPIVAGLDLATGLPGADTFPLQLIVFPFLVFGLMSANSRLCAEGAWWLLSRLAPLRGTRRAVEF